jgi:hypothetical protein
MNINDGPNKETQERILIICIYINIQLVYYIFYKIQLETLI